MVSLSNHAQQHCHPADQYASDKNNRGCLSTPPKPELSYPRPFHGELLPEPFEVGRGSAPPMAGNGPAVRGSSVQGFPCRYYDWRVRTALRKRLSAAGEAIHPKPRPPKRNGRDQKTPDGRSSDRILFYKDALRRPPVFPHASNGQTQDEGVARGKHTLFFEIMMKLRTAA